MTLVTVVIPIYKNRLSELERKSLSQACKVLHAYPIVIVKPEYLDVSAILQEFPCLSVSSFDDSYFRGIENYNRLMLSSQFYGRFLGSHYILIYQLDAYVSRDELAVWCEKGYDYIGAPWLEKPVYRLPFVSVYMRLLHRYKIKRGILSKQSLYNKVGNGGLSLRKVESHYKASIVCQETIDYYLAQKRSHFFYEDVFWATEAPEFKYPDAMEALCFSFDKYPAYCYRLNGKQLPFGCHSWYKRKMKNFWRPIIGF
ncbi:MAG: hypothetical protein LBT25_08365 [Candidatus Symbiothrix sp.]|jgi:hypothetical protein|nr:hypothetical protein [Candidatus Symbiothrix sp.]